MVLTEDSPETISQEIVKHHLELTALIQDIQQCEGPLEILNEYNEEGREKIALLRNNIKKLADLVEFERDRTKKQSLTADVENYKGQLSSAIAAFRKANVLSATSIETKSRSELLSMTPEQEEYIRKRREKQNLTSTSTQLTDRLLDISKYLMETTQMSGETLDSLVTSSDKVTSTRKELEHQQQVIAQSGKLLGKYGRREITDKALLILAFMFFLACVFYILQKRLF